MGIRLVSATAAFFFAAYAQSSPLFFAFGIKPNITLVLAVLAAFYFDTALEYFVLIFAGTLGLAFGIGFPQAILFFSAVFILTRGAREMAPLRPFISGSILIIFFSFLTYASFDWDLVVSLAPSAVREALYNVALFTALYALLPLRYVRKGRY